MCIVGLSESGHGGRFDPCEECKRLQEENEFTGNRVGLLEAENAALRKERDRLAAALQKAVYDYGKPGGPWNVPSEPGTWIMMAKDAMGGE